MKKKETEFCKFCIEDMKEDANHIDECACVSHYRKEQSTLINLTPKFLSSKAKLTDEDIKKIL